jgi:hypothetical protein
VPRGCRSRHRLAVTIALLDVRTAASTSSTSWRRAQAEDADEWETSDFYCRMIGADVYLLTYTLQQPERVTRRSTPWQHANGQWKVLCQQGTIVVDTRPRASG